MFDKKEKELAQNSKDPEELHGLAMNHGPGVKIIVAQNPCTSAKTLRDLVYNADIKTRVAVVYHPNTPIEVLEDLSGSKPNVKGPDMMMTLFVDVFMANMVNLEQFNKLLLAHYALVNLLKRTGKLGDTKVESKIQSQQTSGDATQSLPLPPPPPPEITPKPAGQDMQPAMEKAPGFLNRLVGALPKEVVQTLLLIALQQPVPLLILASRRGPDTFEHVRVLEERGFVRVEGRGENADLVTTEEFANAYGFSRDRKKMQVEIRANLDRLYEQGK